MKPRSFDGLVVSDHSKQVIFEFIRDRIMEQYVSKPIIKIIRQFVTLRGKTQTQIAHILGLSIVKIHRARKEAIRSLLIALNKELNSYSIDYVKILAILDLLDALQMHKMNDKQRGSLLEEAGVNIIYLRNLLMKALRR